MTYLTKEKPEVARFWSYVQKESIEGCWLWTGGGGQHGGGCYGKFTARRSDGTRVTVKAHRYSYELKKGSIKEGHVILHLCDNPRCVNPAHLRAGTHAENMRDMVRKGRNGVGKRVPKTIAERVRMDFAYGLTYQDIAERYDIAYSTVYRITKGQYHPKPDNRKKVIVPKSFSKPIYRH